MFLSLLNLRGDRGSGRLDALFKVDRPRVGAGVSNGCPLSCILTPARSLFSSGVAGFEGLFGKGVTPDVHLLPPEWK